SLSCSSSHRDLHSFPTRRSSDLGLIAVILVCVRFRRLAVALLMCRRLFSPVGALTISARAGTAAAVRAMSVQADVRATTARFDIDRKSTRLNSSHVAISYAVFCL